MKTYFSSSVVTPRGSATGSGADTLAEALSAAIRDAMYYLVEVELPYPSVTIEVREVCDKCYNKGMIRKGLREIRCPECKGRPPAFAVGPFQIDRPIQIDRPVVAADPLDAALDACEGELTL